jgi:hypothetical protein
VTALRRLRWVTAVSVLALALTMSAAPASAVPAHEYETPVFGLAARGEVLYVADAGAGIVRLGSVNARLIVDHPGVTDVAPLRRGRMWATTSAPRDFSLWLFIRRHARQIRIANLRRFERTVNPDGGVIESNPFDVAKLGHGQVLVADAAANALLLADRQGNVDWIATFPSEEVSTQNAKDLAGCPDPPPEMADICDLPPEIPAEAVSTSVAVGPDGAYYVTELKGFPAPVGESRIWRVEPDARNVHCEADVPDSPCSVVADGFTSLIDLNFGADGVAHVVELDEASWFALEVNEGAGAEGGTVNACDSTTWSCTEEATDQPIPMAVAIDESGDIFVVIQALVPGEAEVIQLP